MKLVKFQPGLDRDGSAITPIHIGKPDQLKLNLVIENGDL